MFKFFLKRVFKITCCLIKKKEVFYVYGSNKISRKKLYTDGTKTYEYVSQKGDCQDKFS